MNTPHETDFLLFELIAEFRTKLRRVVASIVHNNMPVLSLEMAEIIICVGKNGKLNQQEVAEITLKDKASVSRLTQKLIDLKLVAAHLPHTDHRLKYLTLTPDGKEVYDKLSAAVQGIYENIRLQLTPGEFTFLLEVTAKLARNIKLC